VKIGGGIKCAKITMDSNLHNLRVDKLTGFTVVNGYDTTAWLSVIKELAGNSQLDIN